MPHATVLVLLDAARADYVRPETMPFLHGLLRQGASGQLESPPGFAQRTVLFSGRYPDTSGRFARYVFDPRRSPFRWVRWLGPAKSLLQPRKAFVPARRTVRGLTQWATRSHDADPAWIPPRLLPYFALCEEARPMTDPGALGAPSLFDLCRRQGLRFRYLAHPEHADDDEVQRQLLADLRARKPVDLYVAQFRATDERGHQDGPDSDAMRKVHLPALDQRLAAVHAALVANFDSWDLLVVGDHGMAPVTREVDVLAALQRADAVLGRDYVVFVNSTLAVFWYLTERGRRAVERVLPGVPGSHVVTEAERRRRRIPTDRRWGDRMLAAEPGVLFWPDFFHVQDSQVQGMHGYLDQRDEGFGILCLASSPGRTAPRLLGLRPLVDVFPTVCDLLRLPIPGTNEGASLLRPMPVAPAATLPPARAFEDLAPAGAPPLTAPLQRTP